MFSPLQVIIVPFEIFEMISHAMKRGGNSSAGIHSEAG